MSATTLDVIPVPTTHYQAIKLACESVEPAKTHIHGVQASETMENDPKRWVSMDFNIPIEEVYLRSRDEH